MGFTQSKADGNTWDYKPYEQTVDIPDRTADRLMDCYLIEKGLVLLVMERLITLLSLDDFGQLKQVNIKDSNAHIVGTTCCRTDYAFLKVKKYLLACRCH